MKNLKGNAMVGQSGGPTSVINATLAGVYEAAIGSNCIETVYGLVHGIEGLLKDDFVDMSNGLETKEDIDILASTPSAYLGSCRFKLPKLDDDTDVYEKIFEKFSKNNIKYFFYIGGNDSMDTVYKLSTYADKIGYEINIMGVPKTIDNDLAMTDHTPGFGSAAKYIATATREINRDATVYAPPCLTIIEIMGRNAGWLTAATALARDENCKAPDLIYLPEITFDIDKFIEDVKIALKKRSTVIVCVSEGVKLADGRYVCEAGLNTETDAFGHKRLTGTGRVLGDIARERLGIKTRHIEFSLLQRCAAHCASATDVCESRMIGARAVEKAIDGESGKMVYFVRKSNSPYEISIESIDIGKIANVEQTIPREWINEEGNDVNQEVIDYMFPLIQGEARVFMKDGLPVHAVLPIKRD